jgi:UDP-N-acetylmuramoylalanine--D-glutamate ligase
VSLIKSRKQLKNKKVLIMGLGTKDGGVGAVIFAKRNGAIVTVTDKNSPYVLKESLDEILDMDITLKIGKHDFKDFKKADIVIANPVINDSNKYLKIAKKAGSIIDTPMGIFSEIVKKPYIGITGTKGKSYTTFLIEHMLKNLGVEAIAAGNNCTSPLRYVDDKDKRFTLELSSWQLRHMGRHKKSPHISCCLNFFPDHLNHYKDINDYLNDKLFITKNQKKDDFIVLPWKDKKLRELDTKAKKIFFSDVPMNSVETEELCFFENGNIFFKTGKNKIFIEKYENLPPDLKIKHHFELLLAAICCIKTYGFKIDEIKESYKNFKGIPHRFEFLGKREGINFINDSAATTPESVILALEAVKDSPLVTIFGGGHHKNLSYNKVAKKLNEYSDKIVIFNKDLASDKITPLLHNSAKEKIIKVYNLEEAVSWGIEYLSNFKKGTLLLSPGCSGAPFYTDLFVRGKKFKEIIENHYGN